MVWRNDSEDTDCLNLSRNSSVSQMYNLEEIAQALCLCSSINKMTKAVSPQRPVVLIKWAVHKYLAKSLDVASTHFVLVIIIIFITSVNLVIKKYWYQVGLHTISTLLQTNVCLLGAWWAILITSPQNIRGTEIVIDNMNNYQLIFKLPDRWLNIPMTASYIYNIL